MTLCVRLDGMTTERRRGTENGAELEKTAL